MNGSCPCAASQFNQTLPATLYQSPEYIQSWNEPATSGVTSGIWDWWKYHFYKIFHPDPSSGAIQSTIFVNQFNNPPFNTSASDNFAKIVPFADGFLTESWWGPDEPKEWEYVVKTYGSTKICSH